MKIKICGMREPENIRQIATLQPDFMGFIFYEKSKRFINLEDFLQLDTDYIGINKVAVFVNESIKNIIRIAKLGNFKYLQLHGDETPEFCEELKYLDFKIIKAFGINEQFDFHKLNEYETVIDYFLFDTQSTEYGGSGKKFDWNLLDKYKLQTPIFLSGGLEISDIETVQNYCKQLPYCLDFNSKLEDKPGLKNIDKSSKVIQLIRKK